MDLDEFLRNAFTSWKAPAPVVVSRDKNSVTLDWQKTEPFAFLRDQLLYQLEKREKIPAWAVVYSGGKISKRIDNLAPRHPHKFRLRIILRAAGVAALAAAALAHYGDVETVVEKIKELKAVTGTDDNVGSLTATEENKITQNYTNMLRERRAGGKEWLASRWSEATWTSTGPDGASAVCFCMAVRCGYIKQLQAMLEERPELVHIPSTNGLTPLATAVRKGDVNTCRFLLQSGAAPDRPLTTGQTPLHLAVLAGHVAIVELLLDKGADFQAQDVNGLRAEHYAVDSCSLPMLRCVLDRGGDLHARDHNGWTPLFRAICQGASVEVVAELVGRGSSVQVTDRAGLALAAAARLLRHHNGGRRESVLRLVDAAYPREAALAHFTRLTKKISSVHSLLK